MFSDINITIPVAKYNELIIAANELKNLKSLLGQEKRKWCGITYQDLEVICKLYGIEEEKENAE